MKALKKIVMAASMMAAFAAQAADYGSVSTVVAPGGTTWNAVLPSDGANFQDTFTFTLNQTAAETRFTANFFDWEHIYGDSQYGTLSLPKIEFTLSSTTQSVNASAILPAGLTGTAQAAATFSTLMPGSYTLTVKGLGIGDNVGSGSYYLGDKYSITVSPVPEPESYAMFLAGLGLMASVVRRRASSVR